MMLQTIQPNSRNGLAGVLVSPDEQPLQAAPLILFFNAGGEYRVGPSRLHVEMARVLANRGFASLRFDQSGFGDSVAQTGESLADVDNLMTFLDMLDAQYSPPGYVCIGLCSGADNALRLAAKDERIRGLVMLDGPAYVNRQYARIRLRHRLTNPRRWRNFLMRFAPQKKLPLELDYWYRDMPSQEEARDMFRTLVSRRQRVLSVFTGGVEDYYNHENQFLENFSDVDFRGLLSHHYFERMTHTYRLAEDRRQLLDTIVNWLKNF